MEKQEKSFVSRRCLWWLLLLLPMSAFGVRARGHWRTHLMADGRQVVARLCGDEWQHYYLSADGSRYERDAVGTLRLSAPVTAPRRIMLQPRTVWDANKTYRQLVVLVNFSDQEFSMADPRGTYHRLFNELGYNQGKGPGCVADYFRDQSAGVFNVEFDVVGPVQVSYQAKSSYSSAVFRAALLEVGSSIKLTDYDWDDDGTLDQVIFIYAGYSGNEDAEVSEGCLWPATDAFSSLSIGGLRIGMWSGSAEMWASGRSCGIGTICHEYSHCLGLPDLYPVFGSEFSVLDEWDLMDGGNYSDEGWCPCNYSIHEKMLLRWADSQPLYSPGTIASLAPLAEGGVAYQVLNDAWPTEYYLLENRQWKGWDFCLPGHGLLISHVDYDPAIWANNRVNVTASHHCYDLFHADGHNYNYYDDLYGDSVVIGDDGRNLRLQHSAYPWNGNNKLTDESEPPSLLYHPGPGNMHFMSKPVTDIVDSADGLVSFLFMGGASGLFWQREAWPALNYEYTIHGTRIVIKKDTNGHTEKFFR